MKKRIVTALALLVMTSSATMADTLKGVVKDKNTGEPLIGATVMVGDRGIATDINGHFSLTGLKRGKHTIIIKYVGYKNQKIDGVLADDRSTQDDIVVEMVSDEQTLGEVKVTGMARKNTDVAMIEAAKLSSVIVNNISAQEIKRTQDNNASEVIRRVPGVSLIEDKFVMVRGLSQRYNNVWINGGAVPSSEADSRAFSFDIIPSSQIDNLVIVKSPSAEYPADFTGGFIQINTKDIPSQNTFSLTFGGNWNDATHFQDFRYANLSSDYIKDGEVSILGSGFNNDWRVKNKKPLGDLKLGVDWSRRWTLGESKLGMVGVVNYTNEYRTFSDMQNNLFGVYDSANDRSN